MTCAKLVLGLGLLFVAGTRLADAQSLNIDLDVGFGPPESGNGAPSSSFPGAAGQPGVWNRVSAGGQQVPLTLNGLDGSPTACQLLTTGGTGIYGGSGYTGNTGDYCLLLNDYARLGGDHVEIDYHFSGLLPGQYKIYTYAVNATGVQVNTLVKVPGSVQGTQIVTGPMPGNQFILGVTHSIHDLTLTGNSFEIDVSGTWPYSECNGFQIESVPEPSTLLLVAAGGFALTWGVWRPLVLLPREAGNWNKQRMRVVMLHEFAHVKRRDYVWQLVANLAVAVYWFHPLAWFAASRTRSAAEDAADDLVIGAGIDAPSYAEELVALATEMRSRSLGLHPAVPIVRSSRLGARIRSILDPTNRRRPLQGIHFIGACLLAAIGLGLAAACRPSPAISAPEWVQGVPMPAPKGTVPPLDRPAFAIFKTIGFVSDGYSNELEGSFDEEWTYPCWSYHSDVFPQRIAHALKGALTKDKGWTLIFPNERKPFAGHASHRANGSVDLDLHFFDAGRVFLTITDKAVLLAHKKPSEPPPAARRIDSEQLAALTPVPDANEIRVPPLARVGGITLGVTTLEEADRVFGKGFMAFGGKYAKSPNGDRRWFDETSKAAIQADGWYRSRRGYIIDEIRVTFDARPENRVSRIRLPLDRLGVLAVFHAGMTRREVEQASHLKLDGNGMAHQPGLIVYPGKIRSRFGPVIKGFATWGILCDFSGEGGTLDELHLWVD